MIASVPPIDDWVVGVLLAIVWIGTWIWIEKQEFPPRSSKSKSKKGRP